MMLTAVDSALLSALRQGGSSPLAVALPSLAAGSRREEGKQRLFRRGFHDLERAWSKMDDYFGSCRNHPILARVRAGKQDGDSFKGEFRKGYHPLEDIEEVAPSNVGERRLSDAETARTIIEVNRKATAIFSGFIDEEVQENIVWSDLSYLTDEHGDVYFEVNNEREILHSMITDDKLVKVVIGLDNVEMLAEMEVSATPDLDFRLEEILGDEDDEDDADDVYEEDVMTILEEVDELLSSGNESGWTNLETMQACHPMYLAEKMSELSEPSGIVETSQGRLLIADTNNNVIRYIDLNKKVPTLYTLELKGVQPPSSKPKSPKRLRRRASADTDIVRIDGGKSMEGIFNLTVFVPEGYHFSKEARSKFEVETDPPDSINIEPINGYLSPDGSASLKFMRNSSSPAMGRINCKVYYCKEDEVCLYQSVAFDVSFKEEPESNQAVVNLSYTVKPKVVSGTPQLILSK